MSYIFYTCISRDTCLPHTYIHMHTYIQTYACWPTYIYIHYIHKYKHILQTYMWMCTCIHTDVVYIQAGMHAHALNIRDIHMHAYMQTLLTYLHLLQKCICMCMWIQAYAYICICV